MNFGGVMETVVTSHEFSLEKAREVLKNETIAVIGYGIQGPWNLHAFGLLGLYIWQIVERHGKRIGLVPALVIHSDPLAGPPVFPVGTDRKSVV